MNNIFFRKRRLIFYSISFGLFMCLVKIGIRSFDFEIFAPTQAGFFTSIFTGVMLILAFLMAGVLKDYKESEKIPVEIYKSIYIIAQEIYITQNTKNSPSAMALLDKLILFINTFKTKFIYNNNKETFALLDSFSDNLKNMDKGEIAAPLMVRLRNEQANIKHLLLRITTIRDTCFSESGYAVMYLIVTFYIIALTLLKIDQFWKGLFFVAAYSTTLFAVVYFIRDMDNPFDYIRGKKSWDDIDFYLLYSYEDELKIQRESLINTSHKQHHVE